MKKIVGILNISEDSFFDGGKFLALEKAKEQTKKLIKTGADIIDIGAASSHPDAKKVSAKEEIKRIKPLIDFCKKEKFKISIDSYQKETQIFALEEKVDYLNDITGFADKSIHSKIAESECQLILMHSLQQGKADKRKQKGDIIQQIIDFFGDRITDLIQAGIKRNRIILDTGMGFFLGSVAETSFKVLQKIQVIKRIFQLPLLLGVSRKSFLQKTLKKDADSIGASGAYLEMLFLQENVDYIRTHSPEFLQDFFQIQKKLLVKI